MMRNSARGRSKVEPIQLNRERLRQQLNRYVPITAWLPANPRHLLRNDIISGVTVWGVTVPVAIGARYGQIARQPRRRAVTAGPSYMR